MKNLKTYIAYSTEGRLVVAAENAMEARCALACQLSEIVSKQHLSPTDYVCMGEPFEKIEPRNDTMVRLGGFTQDGTNDYNLYVDEVVIAYHVTLREAESMDIRRACDECDELMQCDRCGDYVDADTVESVDDGSAHYCRDCIREYACRCDNCGEYYSPENITVDGAGLAYCNDCQDCLDLGICATCGEWTSDYYMIDGEIYCPECAPCASSVRQYHDNPELVFVNHGSEKIYLTPSGEGTRRYYGVEIEYADYDAACLPENVPSGDEGEFWYTSDSSVELEIVSQPTTLDAFQYSSFLNVIEVANNIHMSTGGAGMHVHVNRASLGCGAKAQNETIMKLVLIFNNNWEAIKEYSGRGNEADFMSWAKLNDLTIQDALSLTKEEYTKIIDGKKWCSNRYYALNLTNRATVELRIFNTTTDCKVLLERLEWFDGLIEYCINHSAKECNEYTI